jgi:hypothetical protein
MSEQIPDGNEKVVSEHNLSTDDKVISENGQVKGANEGLKELGCLVCCCVLHVLFWGVGQFLLTVGVADGLAAYKKPISNLAIGTRNHAASLCGFEWFGGAQQPIVMCWQPLSRRSLSRESIQTRTINLIFDFPSV